MLDLVQALEAAQAKLQSQQAALDVLIERQKALQTTIVSQRIAVYEQRHEVERLSAAWAAETDAVAKSDLAQRLEQAKAELANMVRAQERFGIATLKTGLRIDQEKDKVAQLKAEHKQLVEQQVLAAVQAAQAGQGGGGALGGGALAQLKEAQDAFRRMEQALQGVRVQGDPVGEMFHKQKLKIDDAQKAVDKQQKSIETFRAIQQHAAVAFAGGSAGLMGLAAAGSPQAYDTFTQSLQLLATTVGGSLVPYLMKLAYWFQDAAEWVRNLSQETKDGIAKWAVYGVAAAGVTAAGMKLISMLRSAWAVIGQGVAAVRTLIGVIQAASVSLAANPFTAWIVGIGALVAIVGGLALAFHALAHGIESASAKAADLENILDRLASGGKATGKDIRATFTAQEQSEYAQAKDDSERLALAQRIVAESNQALAHAESPDQVAARRARVLEALQHTQQARGQWEWWENFDEWASHRIGLESPATRSRAERMRATREAQTAVFGSVAAEGVAFQRAGVDISASGNLTAQQIRDIASAVSAGSERARTRKAVAESVIAQKGRMPSLAAGGKQHMNALPREGHPHFSPFEEARRQLQLASLGKSPIEEQTLREQRAAWARQEAALNRIADNTAPRNRQPPIR